MNNLAKAWRRARKGKTKFSYVIKFERNIRENLLKLREELLNQNYKPKPLRIRILRDPKTRKISISAFRDRIVHHALILVIEEIFDKAFIYDSCANRKSKGNLFAISRFKEFIRKVSFNGKRFDNVFNDSNYVKGYCLKCDIKHYFQEINHKILLRIVKQKIKCKSTIWLIEQILINGMIDEMRIGMPLGNLTSQFFANVYLNELDQFIKHKLQAKYYIRYVDDFVILNSSKKQLEFWKTEISIFLLVNLNLELHVDKSRIINLSKGIDFVGFRNFYYFKLLRKRNIIRMNNRIHLFNIGEISVEYFVDIFQGWNAYANLANSYRLRDKLVQRLF